MQADYKMQLHDEYPEKAKITLNLHNIASFPFIQGHISVSRGKQSNALEEKPDLQIKAYSRRSTITGNSQNITKVGEELTKQVP